MGRHDILTHFEVAIEKALHKPTSGPFFLQDPRVANLVLDAWKFYHGHGKVFLYALCVMGNHVHVVIDAPNGATTSLGDLLENCKGYTARMANRILERSGLPLWEPGYFDRRIRPGKFMRTMWYVINNPVKAGLVGHWTDWPATWIHPEYLPMFTGVVPDT